MSLLKKKQTYLAEVLLDLTKHSKIHDFYTISLYKARYLCIKKIQVTQIDEWLQSFHKQVFYLSITNLI